MEYECNWSRAFYPASINVTANINRRLSFAAIIPLVLCPYRSGAGSLRIFAIKFRRHYQLLIESCFGKRPVET
jgi:hypothetical protein